MPVKSARGHELEKALKSAGAQVEHAAADPEMKNDLKEVTTGVRKATAIAIFGSLALLLLGAFAAYWGGVRSFAGRKHSDDARLTGGRDLSAA